MRSRAATRSGFTLIEILVVIAIIAILAALTAAGVFQVIEIQRQSNTETTMRTLNKIFQQHMKSVLDKADKETVPPAVISWAGNDMKRARVIWKKLRLKQEFPMTLAEALEPYKDYAGNFVDINPPPNPPPNKIYLLTQAELPSLYAKTFLASTLKPNSSTTPFVQSSTLLLLALKRSRGGAALSPDLLGTSAVDTNGDGFQEIVDGWGTPIAFFRFPTGGPVLNPLPNMDELDSMNPAGPDVPGTTNTAAKFRDPIDPEGTLVSKMWNTAGYDTMTSTWVISSPVVWFERLCHPIHDFVPNNPPPPPPAPPAAGPYRPWSRFMFPVFASTGRNGTRVTDDHKWGLKSAFLLPAGMVFNPDLTADTISVPSRLTEADDNIYSFRLKLDVRGD